MQTMRSPVRPNLWSALFREQPGVNAKRWVTVWTFWLISQKISRRSGQNKFGHTNLKVIFQKERSASDPDEDLDWNMFSDSGHIRRIVVAYRIGTEAHNHLHSLRIWIQKKIMSVIPDRSLSLRPSMQSRCSHSLILSEHQGSDSESWKYDFLCLGSVSGTESRIFTVM